MPFVIRGFSPLPFSYQPEFMFPVVAAFVAVFILLGLWTPVAAAISFCLELFLMINSLDRGTSHLHFAALDLSLIMLGPGAFSIDSCLFGRKRVDLSHP